MQIVAYGASVSLQMPLISTMRPEVLIADDFQLHEQHNPYGQRPLWRCINGIRRRH
jgi:hypothetical protein